MIPRPDNDNIPLRFLSVCSGIEAASVAWRGLNWQAVAFSEIEDFPSQVLAHHYPHVPNLGDFTKIDTTTLGRVDILCGGTPCQAFSMAGARGGLSDERGNLSLEFVRLAHELANGNALRNAVWENVPGVLTMPDNAFGCFLAGLVGADGPFIPVAKRPEAGISDRWWRWADKEKVHAVRWPEYGMVIGPKGRAAWCVKDGQYFGLAQRRERVLVVADFGIGADPAAVLFERIGMQGNPAPSREAGQGVAGTIAGGARASSGYSTDDIPLTAQPLLAKGNSSHDESKETYIPVAYAPEIARCVATREGSSQDFESTTMVAVHAIQSGALRQNPNSGPDGVGVQADIAYTLEARSEVQAVSVTGAIAHSLTAEGYDASEDGSGRRAPIVAFQSKASSTQSMNPGEVVPTPDKGKSDGLAICFTAKDYGADAQVDLAPTLRSGAHDGSHANGGVMPAVAFMTRGSNVDTNGALSGTLGTNAGSASGGAAKVARQPKSVVTSRQPCAPAKAAVTSRNVLTSAVRRLTPKECERLQGFPDDYTRIPMRRYGKPKITKNRPADMWEHINGEWWLMSADGPRYKALGNSWAVPKFTWLGQRIAKHMPCDAAANDNVDRRNTA